MPDISAIAGALAAFNNAKNIAQAMITLRDAAAFQGKMIEFQSAILDAQNAAFAANDERATLLEEIRQLKEKMAKLEAWETEKQRYELQTPPNGGAFFYALKPDTQGAEPLHWLCAACYTGGKKSILQRTGAPMNNMWPWMCSTCKAVVFANYQGPSKS